MDRINTSTKATDLFGAGKHGFRDGDLANAIPPTNLDADWFNGVQEELLGVIEVSGQVSAAGDRAQVRKGIDIMIRRGAGAVAAAAGTADAITAAFTPAVTALYAGMQVLVRAASLNATTTPTFKADGTAAKTIMRAGGSALAVGDIAGAGHWMMLIYDLTLDAWVLDNPQRQAELPAGTVASFAANTAPTGFLKANGAPVSRTTYAALFAVIGTTFGVGNGSTTFNVPDLRGEFIRGWDDSRGVDTGRAFGSAQADALQGHRHNVTSATTGVNAGGSGSLQASVVTLTTTDPITDGTNGTPRIAAETRPRNVALLACIKY
jgi:phage-related tail fiber protein